VRSAELPLLLRVERAGLLLEDRVADAGAETTDRRVVREAVGAWEGPEVVIEGPVLLHDEDEVVQLEDPLGRLRPGDLGGRREQGREQERGGRGDDQDRPTSDGHAVESSPGDNPVQEGDPAG
jgi:hypothetical protein